MVIDRYINTISIFDLKGSLLFALKNKKSIELFAPQKMERRNENASSFSASRQSKKQKLKKRIELIQELENIAIDKIF